MTAAICINWKARAGRMSSTLLILAMALSCLYDTDGTEPSAIPDQGIRIVFPNDNHTFVAGMYVKIKSSDVSSPDLAVKFYADDREVGVSTNSPHFVWWRALEPASGGAVNLTAKLFDTMNRSTATSNPVHIKVVGGPPPFDVFAIRSPTNGQILRLGQSFAFSAEELATHVNPDSEPFPSVLDFFDGTNYLGSAFRPYSLIVSNLVEGRHILRVFPRFINECKCSPITVDVARLALLTPRVSSDLQIRFDVMTAITNNPVVVQSSSNLIEWAPIFTNQTPSNIFPFTTPYDGVDEATFFRAITSP